jgi:gas vesicle protein
MLLAPKAGSELRGALGEQARNLGGAAQEQYKRATESASTWAEKGREFVDRTREAVNRGTEEAREYTGSTGTGASGPSASTIGRTSPGGDFGQT